MFIKNILDGFFLFLEKNSFEITVNEKILLYKAISHIDISSEEEFKSALISILVKDFSKLDVFLYLYDSFFKIENFKKEENTIHEDLESSESIGVTESVLSSYKFKKYDYGATLKYLILNDKNRLNRLIRLAASNIDNVNISNSGMLFNRIKNSLNLNDLEEEIEGFKKELLEKGADKDDVDKVIEKIKNNLKEFKKKIRMEVKNKIKYSKSFDNGISIEQFDAKKLEEISGKIAEKLKKKKKNIYKKALNGKIDIKNTLYKSVGYDLVPMKPYYRKKKSKKRKLVIFADVSDSVRKYTQTVLYLIYSLNKFFKDIKTFVFTSEVLEISNLFVGKNSFEDIYSKLSLVGGNSDYNAAFDFFFNMFGEILDKNTVFVIIGDARNNYSFPDLKGILNISVKVKDIIWLNPESKFLWNSSDSNMGAYQKIVKKVYQIRTIKDMEMFSEEIVFN